MMQRCSGLLESLGVRQLAPGDVLDMLVLPALKVATVALSGSAPADPTVDATADSRRIRETGNASRTIGGAGVGSASPAPRRPSPALLDAPFLTSCMAFARAYAETLSPAANRELLRQLAPIAVVLTNQGLVRLMSPQDDTGLAPEEEQKGPVPPWVHFSLEYGSGLDASFYQHARNWVVLDAAYLARGGDVAAWRAFFHELGVRDFVVVRVRVKRVLAGGPVGIPPEEANMQISAEDNPSPLHAAPQSTQQPHSHHHQEVRSRNTLKVSAHIYPLITLPVETKTLGCEYMALGIVLTTPSLV
jgi:hypothetical protein